MKLLSNNSKSPDIITNTIYFPLCNLFCAKEATFLPISHLRPHKTFIKRLTLFCCSLLLMPFLLADAIFAHGCHFPDHPPLTPAAAAASQQRARGQKVPRVCRLSPPFPPIFPLCASLKTMQCLWLFLAVFINWLQTGDRGRTRPGTLPAAR